MHVGDSDLEKSLEIIWYDKSELAAHQLSEAIELFFDKKYICAITLAGASEEIFSGILQASGKPSALKSEVQEFLWALNSDGEISIPKQAARDWYYSHSNYTRNHLKHYRLDASLKKLNEIEPNSQLDLQQNTQVAIYPLEVVNIIRRAIKNYFLQEFRSQPLNNSISKFEQIEYEN